MKTKKKRRVNMSAFFRDIIMGYVRGDLVWKPISNAVGFEVTRVRYKVMKDTNGHLWDVPMTEDVRRHHPERFKGMFVKIKQTLEDR